MTMNVRDLQRYESLATVSASRVDTPPRPPMAMDLALFGVGNSGEALAARLQARFFSNGVYVPTFGINNDTLAPRPLAVRAPGGSLFQLEVTERLILGGDNPRDQLRAYPLLERRYARLLRGIPVFETYPRAGHGGHGHPAIAALDIDLHIVPLGAFLRRALRQLTDDAATPASGSDVQRLIAVYQRQQEQARACQVVVIGGAAGAMGNAAHQLLPALIRTNLAELGLASATLWGVVLGPQAFTGLTPFVRHNGRALLYGLDYLARHGQRRRYINDLQIDLQAPPYDRVFLLDDPHLPANGSVTSEAELEAFLDQAALSLYLLLRGTVWETVAAHTANPDQRALSLEQSGHPRYMHTVRGVLAGVNRDAVRACLAAHLEVRLLSALMQRLDG